ncbi:hypothetical protein MMC24_004484 [Lignoscripta atroalba]|nr:hypothetical protein [Lignoscripta atroalba]
MKPAEGFSILNGEMKYTFITCTAEAFPSSGSTRIIRKESGRESEKRVMDEQHSDFPGQEDILSMDPSACFPQENNYEKPCTSGPASVKSESTSSAPYFTSDGETAVDKTPETSVISNSPPCIDPCLLEMSDAIQPSPQSNDPDQTIAKKCNEEYEPLLAAWPGLPHNNTQMSLSTAHSNLTLERLQASSAALSHSLEPFLRTFSHALCRLRVFTDRIGTYARAHPCLLAAQVIGTSTLLIFTTALPILGFSVAGPAVGSVAAGWQSSIGAVSTGSLFAFLQSAGMAGRPPGCLLGQELLGIWLLLGRLLWPRWEAGKGLGTGS